MTWALFSANEPSLACCFASPCKCQRRLSLSTELAPLSWCLTPLLSFSALNRLSLSRCSMLPFSFFGGMPYTTRFSPLSQHLMSRSTSLVVPDATSLPRHGSTTAAFIPSFSGLALQIGPQSSAIIDMSWIICSNIYSYLNYYIKKHLIISLNSPKQT